MKNFFQVGDNLPFLQSQLTFPTHVPANVKSGDPVVVGALVGVANADGASASDTIVVSTRGVYTLSVTGTDQNGNSAVAVGDKLYIDGSTAVITKDTTKVPFGVALQTVSSGATAAINIKLQSYGGLGAAQTEQDTISVYSADGAITISAGTAQLTKVSAGAYTLAAPATADNGKKICLIDTVGHAHVVTTPANKIAPSHDTATFNGTVGSYVILEAIAQVWYVHGTSGVAFTEV